LNFWEEKMKSKPIKFLVAVFTLFWSMASFVGLTSAQVDPRTALIGTWEGSAAGARGQDERTIVIRSVKPKADGGWVAVGNYGLSGGKLGRQEIDVFLQDGEVVLRFVDGARKNEARLVLKGDNKLEGTFQRPAKNGKVDTSPFKLEKVAAKAGDDK
jgi:hypothetical protein